MSGMQRSVAGVRGVWDRTLFLEDAVLYAAAFGTYLRGGHVILGRDTRTTGEMLSHAVTAGFMSAGCEVTDIGVCPTPTCQMMTGESDAAGGLVITASHNPEEWNGLKFLDGDGHFLTEKPFSRIMETADQNRISRASPFALKSPRGGVSWNDRAIQMHIGRILNYVPAGRIRSRQFKVVLDAVNGAGSRLLLPLLEQLGCEVIPLYCEESGRFPRGAEPVAGNLGELCKTVRKNRAHAGFAVDPDADRLSVVSEQGVALGEEMTLPIVARQMLKGRGGVVVTNLSTSMTIDRVAESLGARVIRTKIGEANVVAGMKSHKCRIGGEGNGGVIIPDIHYARDSAAGIALILDGLSENGEPFSEFVRNIPRYALIKKKMDCSPEKIPAALAALKKHFNSAEADTTDGVKLVWSNRWIHVRKSGTEGLLRIFAEAEESEEAEAVTVEAEKVIRQVMEK